MRPPSGATAPTTNWSPPMDLSTALASLAWMMKCVGCPAIISTLATPTSVLSSDSRTCRGSGASQSLSTTAVIPRRRVERVGGPGSLSHLTGSHERLSVLQKRRRTFELSVATTSIPTASNRKRNVRRGGQQPAIKASPARSFSCLRFSFLREGARGPSAYLAQAGARLGGGGDDGAGGAGEVYVVVACGDNVGARRLGGVRHSQHARLGGGGHHRHHARGAALHAHVKVLVRQHVHAVPVAAKRVPDPCSAMTTNTNSVALFSYGSSCASNGKGAHNTPE
eukprot:1009082-Pyramimonas_sp.AAC.2